MEDRSSARSVRKSRSFPHDQISIPDLGPWYVSQRIGNSQLPIDEPRWKHRIRDQRQILGGEALEDALLREEKADGEAEIGKSFSQDDSLGNDGTAGLTR